MFPPRSALWPLLGNVYQISTTMLQPLWYVMHLEAQKVPQGRCVSVVEVSVLHRFL